MNRDLSNNRQVGTLFTKPDEVKYQKDGATVAILVGDTLSMVETAGAAETEFISCLLDARAFARAHAGCEVFAAFTIIPRLHGCAQVKMHLECLS